MKYKVILQVGCMALSETTAETYHDAQEIKAKLEAEWNDPVITEGPGLKVTIQSAE